MKHIILIISFFCISSLTCFDATAQPGSYRERQAAEYKNLSNATQRAFAVPDRPYSPSPANKSSASPYSQTSSTPNNSRSSSGSVSGTSSYYNAFADGSVARRKAAYEAKLDAREKEWQEKVSRVRSYLASSGIMPNTPEGHQRFFMQAYREGLDVSAISYVIMDNAEEYNKAVARTNGMNENYTGSTKKECSGSCTETVTYVNGSGVYTGNTKDGAPHGYGTITFSDGQTITGQFYEGNISGGRVKIYFPPKDKDETGATYEGGYANNALNGFGMYIKGGDVYEGEYKDAAMMGKFTHVTKKYIHSGNFTNNKMTGKHQWAYKDGRIIEQDMDDPNAEEIVIAEGRGQAPPPGSKKYTFESGAVYEGEPVVEGKPFRGKYIFPDGTITEGLHDKDGYLLKGLVKYETGYQFEGEFRNRQRYRGTYVYKHGTFTGEFEPKGINFVVGRQTSLTGVISDMFFGPKNTNLGYRRTRRVDGAVVEEIYKDDKTPTYLVYHRTSGDVFTGLWRAKEGYQFFGVNKSPDGTLKAHGLSTQPAWQDVAPEDEAAAKAAAIQGRKAIDEGRAAYLAAMKWSAITLE